MKNNKEETTAKEQDIEKLGTFFSERKACRLKWLAKHYVYQADEYALHGTYSQATGID